MKSKVFAECIREIFQVLGKSSIGFEDRDMPKYNEYCIVGIMSDDGEILMACELDGYLYIFNINDISDTELDIIFDNIYYYCMSQDLYGDSDYFVSTVENLME